jgi:hypothetical protein
MKSVITEYTGLTLVPLDKNQERLFVKELLTHIKIDGSIIVLPSLKCASADGRTEVLIQLEDLHEYRYEVQIAPEGETPSTIRLVPEDDSDGR